MSPSGDDDNQLDAVLDELLSREGPLKFNTRASFSRDGGEPSDLAKEFVWSLQNFDFLNANSVSARDGFDPSLLTPLLEASPQSLQMARTSLFAGIRLGHISLIVALLESGVSANTKGGDEEDGMNLLHYAISFDETVSDTLPLLLKHGAALETLDSEGDTALVVACVRRNEAASLRLLDAGAKPDRTTTDRQNLLHVVCGGARPMHTLLRRLLEAGLDVQAKTRKAHRTPLHLAATVGDMRAASLLLDFKAELEAQDSEGNTALHVAAKNGRARILAFLVSRGAKVAAADKMGRTALHVVSDVDCAEILLDNESPIDALDAQGRTPLIAAVMRAKPELARLFALSGAALGVVDKEGQSARDYMKAGYCRDDGLYQALRVGSAGNLTASQAQSPSSPPSWGTPINERPTFTPASYAAHGTPSSSSPPAGGTPAATPAAQNGAGSHSAVSVSVTPQSPPSGPPSANAAPKVRNSDFKISKPSPIVQGSVAEEAEEVDEHDAYEAKLKEQRGAAERLARALISQDYSGADRLSRDAPADPSELGGLRFEYDGLYGAAVSAAVHAATHGLTDLLAGMVEAFSSIKNDRPIGPGGETLLELAVRGGHVEAAKALLARGAEVGSRASSGEPVFTLACAVGSDAMVSLVLQHGLVHAPLELISFATPALEAAERNPGLSGAARRELQEKLGEPNVVQVFPPTDASLSAAVLRAIKAHAWPEADRLSQDSNIFDVYNPLRELNESGSDPSFLSAGLEGFFQACQLGMPHLLDCLMKIFWIDVDTPHPGDRGVPLEWAMRCSDAAARRAVTDRLLGWSPSVGVNGSTGTSVFLIACARADDHLFLEILRRITGSDVEEDKGLTALRLAVQNPDLSAASIDQLLEHEVDPRVHDLAGKTALDYAATLDGPRGAAVAAVLLKWKEALDEKDNGGRTRTPGPSAAVEWAAAGGDAAGPAAEAAAPGPSPGDAAAHVLAHEVSRFSSDLSEYREEPKEVDESICRPGEPAEITADEPEAVVEPPPPPPLTNGATISAPVPAAEPEPAPEAARPPQQAEAQPEASVSASAPAPAAPEEAAEVPVPSTPPLSHLKSFPLVDDEEGGSASKPSPPPVPAAPPQTAAEDAPPPPTTPPTEPAAAEPTAIQPSASSETTASTPAPAQSEPAEAAAAPAPTPAIEAAPQPPAVPQPPQPPAAPPAPLVVAPPASVSDSAPPAAASPTPKEESADPSSLSPSALAELIVRALKRGRYEVADRLCKTPGYDPQDALASLVDAEVKMAGFKALTWAAENGSVPLIRTLLKSGAANASVPNSSNGDIAVFKAIKPGRAATVAAFISLGTPVEAVNRRGVTPFLTACEAGDTGTAQLLVDRGANYQRVDKACNSALHFAALNRGSQADVGSLVRWLCDLGVDPNGHTREEAGSLTPLALAVRSNNLAAARVLLEHGAFVNAADSLGRSPIFSCSSVEMARLLLDKGASVWSKDPEGRTPLHTNSDAEIATLLIEKGADVNAQDVLGRTPLVHHILSDASTSVPLLLVGNKADVKIADKDGNTALKLVEGGKGRCRDEILLEILRNAVAGAPMFSMVSVDEDGGVA